jgi:hypothetical protein
MEIEMKCPNCGAPVDDGAISCQYCGWENSDLVKSNNENEINGIYQRIFSMLGLPDSAAKKAGKILTRLSVALVICFLIAIVLTAGYALVIPKISYRRQQSNLAKLEAVYITGDYEKLYEQLRKMGTDMYSSVYDKYYDIASLNNLLVSVEDGIDNTMSFYGRHPDNLEDYIKDDLYYPLNILNQCQQAKQLGYPHDNGDAYENISARATAILMNDYHLDDSEIAQGIALIAESKYGRPDLTDLAVISAARILVD